MDLEAVRDKLVRRRRGGYCFEDTVLYAAALERLGYRAERLTARVRPDTGGSRTHQLVVSDIDEARRRLLKSHELTTEYPDGRQERAWLSTAQILQTLTGTFGRIQLDAAKRRSLADNLDASAEC